MVPLSSAYLEELPRRTSCDYMCKLELTGLIQCELVTQVVFLFLQITWVGD